MKRWSLVACSLILGGLIGVVAAGSYLRGQPVAGPIPVVPKEYGSYRDIVKKVLPGVVSIEAESARPVKGKAPKSKPKNEDDDNPLHKFFDQTPDNEDDSPELGFGSGFLVDPKGVVLTNYHVVEGADHVKVQLTDGRTFLSKDIKTDPKSDLAIVRLQTKADLPYLELGDSDQMEIGDRVLAVGAPFGLTGTVTSGIVSAKGRSLRMNMYEDFVQTDAAINPGNSGGPLINLEGKVIGINSAIKSRSGGFQGIGLAISSNLVHNVMDQLLKDGSVHRGYLGVQIKDVDDEALASRLGLKQAQGVLVTKVYEDGPAGKAGLQEGDVVVGLGGKTIKDTRDLQGQVALLPLNKPVELSVVRDGKPTALQVTIVEQPSEFGTSRVPRPRLPDNFKNALKLDKIDAEGADLTPGLADKLGYKKGLKGVLVTEVDRGGLASEAGLAPGMVVTKVEREPVTTATDLRDKLTAAALDKGVLLQVESPLGGVSYVLLKAGATANP